MINLDTPGSKEDNFLCYCRNSHSTRKTGNDIVQKRFSSLILRVINENAKLVIFTIN